MIDLEFAENICVINNATPGIIPISVASEFC